MMGQLMEASVESLAERLILDANVPEHALDTAREFGTWVLDEDSDNVTEESAWEVFTLACHRAYHSRLSRRPVQSFNDFTSIHMRDIKGTPAEALKNYELHLVHDLCAHIINNHNYENFQWVWENVLTDVEDWFLQLTGNCCCYKPRTRLNATCNQPNTILQKRIVKTDARAHTVSFTLKRCDSFVETL